MGGWRKEAKRLTNTYFEELMENFNCHTEGKTAFGVVKCYPYSVEHDRSTGNSVFIMRFGVDGSARSCLATLKESVGDYTKWSVEKDVHGGDGAVVIVTIEVPSEFYVKSTIHSVLAVVPDILSGAGRHPIDTCPLCGKGNCDTYAYLDDAYRVTHADCLEHKLELPANDRVEKPKIRGNYITGYVGAIIGAFIGLIPNWTQAFSSGRITPLFYAFVPIFSALIFRLMRGKADRIAAAVMVLTSSVLAAFVLELVWYWLVLTSQLGHNISLAQSTASYFASHTLVITFREMFSSL